jgi:hypothetical protein
MILYQLGYVNILTWKIDFLKPLNICAICKKKIIIIFQ